MITAAMFTYGLLTSFVLSGASHHRRLRQPNPAMLDHVGYVLLGMSGTASVLLTGYAVASAVG